MICLDPRLCNILYLNERRPSNFDNKSETTCHAQKQRHLISLKLPFLYEKYWRTDMITHTVPVMYDNTLIPTHTL